MLEKLSSDLLSAKLDSLHTLAAGCECFGARGLSPYLQALWMAIRKEVCMYCLCIYICIVQVFTSWFLQIFQSVSQDVEVSSSPWSVLFSVSFQGVAALACAGCGYPVPHSHDQSSVRPTASQL